MGRVIEIQVHTRALETEIRVQDAGMCFPPAANHNPSRELKASTLNFCQHMVSGPRQDRAEEVGKSLNSVRGMMFALIRCSIHSDPQVIPYHTPFNRSIDPKPIR